MNKFDFDFALFEVLRNYRGVTLKELGAAMKLSPSAFSMLKSAGGVLRVSEEREAAILDVLKVSSEMLRLRWIPQSTEMQFRKRSTMSSKKLGALVARIQLMTGMLDRVASSNFILPSELFNSPKGAAIAVRKAFRIEGPVRNVMKLAENLGLMVVPIDSDCQKFDAVMQLDSLQNGIIFYERSMPVDRLRATIAHEIGHYVLQHWGPPSEQNEDDAWAFAGELLMPEDQSVELSGITIRSAMDTKVRWGVSMGFAITRSKALGYINAARSTSLWTQMSAAGLRTNEPQFPKIWPTERPVISIGTIRTLTESNSLFMHDTAKEIFAEALEEVGMI